MFLVKKVAVSNLAAGQVVNAGFVYDGRDSVHPNRFIGFKIGTFYFSRLRHMKEFYNVRTLSELESLAERLNLGPVTAEWSCPKGHLPWSAYLWAGCFRSSRANRLILRSCK